MADLGSAMMHPSDLLKWEGYQEWVAVASIVCYTVFIRTTCMVECLTPSAPSRATL